MSLKEEKNARLIFNTFLPSHYPFHINVYVVGLGRYCYYLLRRM